MASPKEPTMMLNSGPGHEKARLERERIKEERAVAFAKKQALLSKVQDSLQTASEIIHKQKDDRGK